MCLLYLPQPILTYTHLFCRGIHRHGNGRRRSGTRHTAPSRAHTASKSLIVPPMTAFLIRICFSLRMSINIGAKRITHSYTFTSFPERLSTTTINQIELFGPLSNVMPFISYNVCRYILSLIFFLPVFFFSFCRLAIYLSTYFTSSPLHLSSIHNYDLCGRIYTLQIHSRPY